MDTTEAPPAATPPQAADAAPLLRTYLANRSEPCPNCRYDLRGLTGTKCPECGLKLVLRVGLAEPKQAAFIAGLIGLAVSMGFSGLLLIYVALLAMRGMRTPPLMEFLPFVAVPFVISLAGLLAWLWNRGRLRRAAHPTRWVLAAAAWALPVVNILVFTFNVR